MQYVGGFEEASSVTVVLPEASGVVALSVVDERQGGTCFSGVFKGRIR
jgi:hypothetical protein